MGADLGFQTHGRLRKRGTESVSESGMKWMSGGANATEPLADRAGGEPSRQASRTSSPPGPWGHSGTA
jgi:hypothetical protein